ncbi:MAG: zinc-dependent metalloprotease [Acidimicrobiales bacterium]
MGPFGSGGPFEDIMRNLARLFTSSGPVNWDVARQFALWAATGGQPEPNVDPIARVRMEELLRVAELHVQQASGFDLPGGALLTVRSVTPSEWAQRTLEAWRPLLERLAKAAIDAMGPGEQGAGAGPGAGGSPGSGASGSGGSPGSGESGGSPGSGESSGSGGSGSGGAGGWLSGFAGGLPGLGGGGPGDAMASLFGNLPQVLGPFLFGMQSGSMVGELARRAMGQYDLPMPRPPASELLAVPVTVDAFASDWSLSPDDVRLWVCLREVANHTVLGRPHVRERLDELIGDYVGAFRPDTDFLEQRLAGIDPTDFASLQQMLGDPSSLLSEMQNDTQRRIQVPLLSLLSVVAGWVDHVMDKAGRPLIDSFGPLSEALRRRRLEDHSGARALGQLFGVELDADGYDRGQRFIDGVIERAGEEALTRLWRSAVELPTPAEVDAPGLWLARIDLELPGEE